MAAEYYWTTGPISSSLGLDHIIVEVLNNTSTTRSAIIKAYDLSSGTPIIMFTKHVKMKAFSSVSKKISASEATVWEICIITSTKKVSMWAGGQDDAGMNLIGNVILSSEFKYLYHTEN